MQVRLEQLTKVFDQKVTAVDHMSLTFNDGELIGLLGPSGCGKSTTLFMLAGLKAPTSGQIFFGDQDVTKLPPEKRDIGLVFQNYALYPHMTVEQNITFPLLNMNIKKAQAKKMASEMADLVQIGDLLRRKPAELSGGQQQRVAIARALVKKPSLLLLDEPLSNLDARLRLETREEIKRIQREVGITTIFVTHDQEEAMSISDTIAVMDKGVLQQYESPQTMYKNPRNLFVAKFLGTPPINVVPGTVIGQDLTIYDQHFAANMTLPEGGYQVGIRPESIIVGDEGVPMKVAEVEMTGRDLLLFLELGDVKFRALVDSDHEVKVGDLLKVKVKQEGIYIFDNTTVDLLRRV